MRPMTRSSRCSTTCLSSTCRRTSAIERPGPRPSRRWRGRISPRGEASSGSGSSTTSRRRAQCGRARTPWPRTSSVEHPITPNFELTATRPPDARTADVYRWNLACPPREVTLFRVEERHYTWQTQRLLDQSYAALQEYLNDRWLDSTTLAQIA